MPRLAYRNAARRVDNEELADEVRAVVVDGVGYGVSACERAVTDSNF
jgi:hypothetical protein